MNAADTYIVRGKRWLIRLAFGLFRPRVSVPGGDASGRVIQVGSKVTALRVGDEVIADLSSSGFGAFAEQVRAPASVWVRRPQCLSLVESAALPKSGMTALQAIRDVAQVRPNERVLIVGASSGVGSFAVQIARALGGHVTAACRADKAAMFEHSGVDKVIDTAELEAPQSGNALSESFDVVLDCSGHLKPLSFRYFLRQGGRFVLVGGPTTRLLGLALFGPLLRALAGHKYTIFLQLPSAKLLSELVTLVEHNGVRPVIDHVYSLTELPAALQHMEQRRTRGKVVVSITT